MKQELQRYYLNILFGQLTTISKNFKCSTNFGIKDVPANHYFFEINRIIHNNRI